MPEPLNLAGHRFGRLIAKIPIPRFRFGQRGWLCRCDCGNAMTATVQALQKGKVKSCGCLRRERYAKPPCVHGHSRRGRHTPTYTCWLNMIGRCTNPNNRRYSSYGGRGITVCARWRSFESFLADMGEKPAGLSIERIKVNGNYGPRNCKWATAEEQANNQRTNRRIKFNGETLTLAQWARRLGVNQCTLHWRLSNWPLERALAPSNQKP